MLLVRVIDSTSTRTGYGADASTFTAFMFETAVQEEHAGVPSGILIACVAFVVLVVVGYILIA